MKTPIRTLLWFSTLLLSLLCAAGLAGCASSKQPGGYSHGAVTIKDRSDAEIRQVSKAVFAENQYALKSEGADYMEFERPGSRRDALKWGGWFGEGVVIRAKLKMTKLADNSCLLQLDMYSVRDAGDSVFEDESRMIMANKRPYRQLMEEIGKRLNAK
jgi:hypothetical protein